MEIKNTILGIRVVSGKLLDSGAIHAYDPCQPVS